MANAELEIFDSWEEMDDSEVSYQRQLVYRYNISCFQYAIDFLYLKCLLSCNLKFVPLNLQTVYMHA